MNLVEYLNRNDRAQLLRELDGAEDPRRLRPGSHKKVIWHCPNGHEYEATVFTRTGRGSGCPYCAGLKAIIGENDIPSSRPDLLTIWDTEKNGSADGVMPKSHNKVWWKCEKGHSWQQRIYAVADGSRCPYCSGLVPIVGETDLATTHPQLAAEWDYEKNDLTPQEVSKGSTKMVHWLCPEGHRYQAVVFSRVRDTACPYCSGKKVLPGFNDLATTDPELCKEWSENNTLKPTEVNRGSHKKVNWVCSLGHEYESAVYSHVAGNGCPYCNGRKVLAGFNDLATTHPQVAAQWAQELNGDITPEMVSKGSNKKFWFKCSEGHYWQAVVFSRTRARASDCPICAGNTNAAKRHKRVTRMDRIKQREQSAERVTA